MTDKDDTIFEKACELAKVKPTTRQRSKYKNQRGDAWAMHHKARAVLRNAEKKAKKNASAI